MDLIGISGTSRSGKTTLWRDLRAALGSRASAVEDLPRRCLELVGPEVAERDIEGFQQYVGWAQVVAECDSPATPSLRLLDKCLIDALAYWQVLVGGRVPAWAAVLGPQRYRIVVLCDHEEIKAPCDPLQARRESIRDAIAERIRELAPKFAREVVSARGPARQRLRMVVDLLEQRGLLSPTIQAPAVVAGRGGGKKRRDGDGGGE